MVWAPFFLLLRSLSGKLFAGVRVSADGDCRICALRSFLAKGAPQNDTSRLLGSEMTRSAQHWRQPMKPRLLVGKLARLGKTEGRLAALTPNHVARVAAYWSRAVVGIQRPFWSASLGPPSARVGKVP